MQYLKPTIRLLSGLVVAAMLTACGTPKEPDEVTLAFWDAMQSGKLKAAAQLTTDPTQELKPLNENSRNATLEIGEITLQGDAGAVATSIIKKDEDGSDRPVDFQTYLVKTQPGWRVDWQQTWSHLTRGNGSLADVLEGLARSLTEGLDQSMGQLSNMLPKLSEQLQQLGETSVREMQKNWEQVGPEIEQSITELSSTLDQTMQKGSEKMQKDLAEGVEELQKQLPEIQKDMEELSKEGTQSLAESLKQAIKELNEELQNLQKEMDDASRNEQKI